MPEKIREHRKIDAKFKLCIILGMRNNNLSYYDTAKKYLDVESKITRANNITRLKSRECIFLEEGETGLMAERCGRVSGSGKGQPPKKTLKSEQEKNLIAENGGISIL